MTHPKLPHMPGILGEWVHDVSLSLLCLMIDGIDVLYQKDDLNATASLPWWKKM
ncbi:hypothetical protein KSC_057140 [Ktedonobacter sp. SOSP1-52]|nr:hypothetical protein KSC_057140 [Ktedonobacter sp. SOSP1-52]